MLEGRIAMSQDKSASMFGSAGSSNGRVLVVEDDSSTRNRIRLMLEKEGYDVLEARDEASAIETIRSGENPLLVDVALIDVDMAKGTDVVAYFKNQFQRVSLIVMTGVPDRGDSRERIKVAIVGAGKGGSALLDMFSHVPEVEIVGIADKFPSAPGLMRARELNMPCAKDPASLIAREDTDLIVDVTGDPGMATVIARQKAPRAEVLGGAAAKLLWTLVRHEAEMQQHVLNSEKLARMVREGVTSYVIKPVGAERLSDAVASAMERREIYKL
jgi:CheY-like chemotaxis protein